MKRCSTGGRDKVLRDLFLFAVRKLTAVIFQLAFSPCSLCELEDGLTSIWKKFQIAGKPAAAGYSRFGKNSKSVLAFKICESSETA